MSSRCPADPSLRSRSPPPGRLSPEGPSPPAETRRARGISSVRTRPRSMAPIAAVLQIGGCTASNSCGATMTTATSGWLVRARHAPRPNTTGVPPGPRSEARAGPQPASPGRCPSQACSDTGPQRKGGAAHGVRACCRLECAHAARTAAPGIRSSHGHGGPDSAGHDVRVAVHALRCYRRVCSRRCGGCVHPLRGPRGGRGLTRRLRRSGLGHGGGRVACGPGPCRGRDMAGAPGRSTSAEGRRCRS